MRLTLTRGVANIFLAAGVLVAGAWGQTTTVTTPDNTAGPAKAAAVTKVATVNLQALIANTNEGKRDLEAMKTRFESQQTQLKSANDEVASLQKQLDASRGFLSQEELAQRAKVLQDKQAAFQRDYEQFQNDVNQEQDAVGSRIWQKVLPVLIDYARSHGYEIAVDVSAQGGSVLWASGQNDITKAVADAYNAKSEAAPANAKPSVANPVTPATGTPTAPPH